MNIEIEFKGYISGKAEKHFRKKAKMIGLNIILISLLLFCPAVLIFGIKTQSQILVKITLSAIIIMPLTLLIPKIKKEWKSMTPKRIFIEEECIICSADKYTETKYISDVKKVYDHGEFYELVFPFGKISEKFVCQKDLLIKGTLQDFENLFEKKIIKK